MKTAYRSFYVCGDRTNYVSKVNCDLYIYVHFKVNAKCSKRYVIGYLNENNTRAKHAFGITNVKCVLHLTVQYYSNATSTIFNLYKCYMQKNIRTLYLHIHYICIYIYFFLV